MVDFPEDFDPNDVPPDERSFDPIPAGDYLMQVIESDIQDTKDRTGQMLVLTFEILEGVNSNRRIWERLNIRNANAQAQQIAQRALADLCIAVGITTALKNTDQLHFKPFIGRVKIREDKTGQYGPQNSVRRYRAANGAPPPQKDATPAQPARRQAAAPQQRQAAAAGARPWK